MTALGNSFFRIRFYLILFKYKTVSNPKPKLGQHIIHNMPLNLEVQYNWGGKGEEQENVLIFQKRKHVFIYITPFFYESSSRLS